jgi:transposase
MGRAYSQDQRDRVKALLEAGRDEETIEKETQVSDRTIRRWKMELERTGRIGKPPESRTGRHRVLNPEVETVSKRSLSAAVIRSELTVRDHRPSSNM